MEFNPYSKADQLKGHQREKEKPKHKNRRPRKKKNPQLYRGRMIPTKKERTMITPENYNRMIEEFGEYCLMCGHPGIEAHHIVFRSQFGTGNWRNLAPLCNKCHRQAHQQAEFAQLIRDMRAERFGIHFGKDKWSLFKEGLIPNSTDEAYERFMKREEEANG
ncbi:HNH endonuclease [Bacillus testis]|uniref:HNH endonuclease n=1 Tax=Bacillus testis TaxID=1622072 RepID=UPI00067ECB28|nr:HNH endonuclease signature motif containing protein [Bacillus testis]